MRIAVLTSHTNNTPPIYMPLEELGHEIIALTYDIPPLADHPKLVDAVRKFRPDWTLYIGGIPHMHPLPVPRDDILSQIGAMAPLVHFCCDGVEPPWWDVLEGHYRNGRFALQVNLDGVRTGPIGARGMTCVAPFNMESWPIVPWQNRKNWCGFSGHVHGNRYGIVEWLRQRNMITIREHAEGSNYADYKSFALDSRLMLNFCRTAMETGDHITGRPTEAAASQSLLIETEGSPLEAWFDKPFPWLRYGSAEDVATQIQWAKDNTERARTMARRFRKIMIQEHSPAVLYSQVMERIGFGKAISPIRELKYIAGPLTILADLPTLPRVAAANGVTKIVVVGALTFTDSTKIGTILDRLNSEIGGAKMLIDSGNRPTDRHARVWAQAHNVKWQTLRDRIEANGGGQHLGRRNILLLQIGSPEYVVTFGSDEGTRDMAQRCRDQGIPCIENP